MGKGRLELFSDAVLAIVITIMVLELEIPHSPSLRALSPLVPILLSYVLSFAYVGIYWTNHHHLLQATSRVTGLVLWANLHLLFWLSLLPFATGWMGENHFAAPPTAVYGGVLLAAAIAYLLLQQAIIAAQGDASMLQQAVGRDWKGRISPLLYVCGILLTFEAAWLGQVIYASVALLWFVPDRRIERSLAHQA